MSDEETIDELKRILPLEWSGGGRPTKLYRAEVELAGQRMTASVVGSGPYQASVTIKDSVGGVSREIRCKKLEDDLEDALGMVCSAIRERDEWEIWRKVDELYE